MTCIDYLIPCAGQDLRNLHWSAFLVPVGCGHCDHPYRNDDSGFTKGMIKMIIPSIGGVRLRGLFVMLPIDSTSTVD
ncbi:hypothetical protein KQL69_001981 [Escherichia coli]|nr:hypothetical protein [Escherichia coli]EHP9644736.1 hypothetical protein [Escherichia coli]EHP9683120.1 hypothetical protein [Escherichia coli]EHP9688372.1 hypothetical protein [Escherichia coli]EHP9718026.1 hypothetical protein [Escherichia coli]